MICQNCKDGRETECLGRIKHHTWCDWQGYPHDTVILQAQFCKHLRASETYCPTCGSTFEQSQDRDSAGAGQISEEQPLDFGYLSLPEETQRDIEDNFVTDQKLNYVEQRVKEQLERTGKNGSYSLSRRNKEAPPS